MCETLFQVAGFCMFVLGVVFYNPTEYGMAGKINAHAQDSQVASMVTLLTMVRISISFRGQGNSTMVCVRLPSPSVKRAIQVCACHSLFVSERWDSIKMLSTHPTSAND